MTLTEHRTTTGEDAPVTPDSADDELREQPGVEAETTEVSDTPTPQRRRHTSPGWSGVSDGM